MTRTVRTDRRAAAGFTLIEVMVGLALMAMLMTVILASVQIGTRSWNQAQLRTNDLGAMTAVQNLLRQIVASARPAFATANPADKAILFSGGPETMRLVAPRPASQGLGPWTLLDLHLVQTGGTQTLFLSWSTGNGAPAHNERLLGDVAALRMDYFGAPLPGERARWQSRWTRADKLPALVRLRITRMDESLSPWPQLIIATRANANATCVRNPSGNACQRMR